MPKFNKNQYSLPEAYKFYKTTTTTTEPVSYKQYKLILDTWGEKIIEYLLLGKDVKLHSGLSTLGIRKKIKRTFINRKESKRRGTLIKSSNIHSGFYVASVYWRRHYTAFSSGGWTFIATRQFKKELSKVMLAPLGHTRYVQRAIAVSNQKHARATYNKKILKL
jgi:nucleoid DNA-binding protein